MRTLNPNRLEAGVRVHFYPVMGASYSFDGEVTGKRCKEELKIGNRKIRTGVTLYEIKRTVNGDKFWVTVEDVIAVYDQNKG